MSFQGYTIHLNRCLVQSKVSFHVVVRWYKYWMKCLRFLFRPFFLYHFQKIDELWLCDNVSFQIKKQQSDFVKDNHEFPSA